MAISGNFFWSPQLGRCYWHLVDRGPNIAKQPIMPSVPPPAKNYPTPHFSNNKVEHPYLRGRYVSSVEEMRKLRLRRHDLKFSLVQLYPSRDPVLKGLRYGAGF